jgi:hypothetical protein
MVIVLVGETLWEPRASKETTSRRILCDSLVLGRAT